jgi:alpha-glucosidase (family GH31 glycosyl hydrolase)
MQSFVKPLWLYHFNDLACFSIEDQFFSGSSDVMIAPFLSESGGRSVYLPEGKWILLTNQSRYEGRKSYFIERTEDLPVFVLEESKWLKLFVEAYRHQ